jgi:hypothetical protein
VQDLHGQDAPWAGGAGKNKMPLVLADIKAANTTGTWSGNTYTISNATFTVNIDDDGNVVSIIGKGNGSAGNALLLPFTLSAGSYVLSSGFDEMNGTNDTFLQSNGVTIARGNSDSPGQSFTLSQDSSCNWLFRVSSAINYICTPMIRLATVSDATFEPYSNICPISGWTEEVITVADDTTTPTVEQTYTIPFTDGQGQSVEVFGGSVDVVNGVVTPCTYYASYNGEQLTGEWISDRDVYAEGTTPTIGAQVVNIGATGTPFNTQPTSIKSLDGENNLSASTGQIETLEFFTKEA